MPLPEEIAGLIINVLLTTLKWLGTPFQMAI